MPAGAAELAGHLLVCPRRDGWRAAVLASGNCPHIPGHDTQSASCPCRAKGSAQGPTPVQWVPEL